MVLSIIIVNYNTSSHLSACLESISDNLSEIEHETIVVDNNSTDRSIENFKDKFQEVSFWFRNSNDGFGAGCNYGVRNAKGKYILFINPDIEIMKNSVQQLVGYAVKNENSGVLSGSLKDKDGNYLYSYNNFPGVTWEFKEAFGLGLSSTIDRLNERTAYYSKINDAFEVDWFHGACMLIKRDLFLKTSGFDENIFLYYEDVDLCKRIKSRGFKNVCIPMAEFYHYERSSVRGDDGEFVYFYFMHKSKLYYMKKNFHLLKRLFIRLMWICGSLNRIVMLPFRKKYKGKKSKKFKQYLMIMKIHMNLPVSI